MKKVVLSLSILAAMTFAAKAQTGVPRYVLYEEFTGENCGPCAATNPGLWTLMSTAPNPSNILLVKYMSPIPSAGPFYYQDQTVTDTRISYYAVPFAPYARLDGTVADPTTSSPGHPGYLTQADIDGEHSRRSNFTMTATQVWNPTFDSIITTVTVHCDSTFAPVGSSLYLRSALVETVDWATPPGNNGETHFENVVRTMFPNAGGTVIDSNWTAGTTQTFTIRGKVPTYVDKSNNPYMVVWIQNDIDKYVEQMTKAAPVPLTLDAGLTATPSTNCVSGTSGSAVPTVTLMNTASTTLSSATIYYAVDGGAFASQAWTGSLAAGASTSVTLGSVTITPGSHILVDSVASPNGATDVNPINNAVHTTLFVQSTTPNAMPLTNNFETTMPANWTYFDANGNGQKWATTSAAAHTGGTGTKAAKHDNYDYPSGETNYIILPTVDWGAGDGANLTFWVAYAQYAATFDDSLQVVYSSDCGTTWSTAWGKDGATLATTPTLVTSAFAPTATQWRQENAYFPHMAAGTIIAFRAVSNFGNNVFVDDISINDVPAGINTVSSASAITSLYPNPAADNATLSVNMSSNTTALIQLTDVTGRIVLTIANGELTAGAHSFSINTSDLASGLYNVVIRTSNGVETQKLSVAK